MTMFLREDLWKRLETMIHHPSLSSEEHELRCEIRDRYIALAMCLIDALSDETIHKAMALTHLEDSLLRAIEALEVEGTPEGDAC